MAMLATFAILDVETSQGFHSAVDFSVCSSFMSFSDRVFGPNCSTRQVYEEGAKEVALSVVSGINCMYKTNDATPLRH